MELSAENINQIISTEKAFALLRIPGDNKLIVKAGNWERKKITELKSECFYVHPFSCEEKGYALIPVGKEEKIKSKKTKPAVTSMEEYGKTFEAFQKNIQSGKVSKLVLSRIIKGSEEKINVGESFFSLCENYPLAAVNLFHIPGVGLWMGASPETLLKSDKETTLTMSLAGTISSTEKKWTAKEKKEQQIVTDFVVKAFSDQPELKQKEEILRAGNVQHLCTLFEIPTLKLKTDWKKIVNDLHPTPAVGGFPKEGAIKIIHQEEKHNREFYAGYLGLINPAEGCHLFVNIRCMKLVDSIPYIYSGGGITAESEVEKEWDEAGLKARGLINSLSVGEK